MRFPPKAVKRKPFAFSDVGWADVLGWDEPEPELEPEPEPMAGEADLLMLLYSFVLIAEAEAPLRP